MSLLFTYHLTGICLEICQWFEPKPGSRLATVFGGAIQAQLLFKKDPAQGILAWVLCLKSPRIQSP